MTDRISNQTPAGERGREQGRSEDRSLTRRQGQRQPDLYRGYRRSSWASPFEMMRRFSEDVDRMFSSMGFGSWDMTPGTIGRESEGPAGSSRWAPSVDVLTRGDDLVVSAELPGIKPEDIEIEVEEDNLVIRGESRSESADEDKDRGYWYSERRYGSFYRTIPLPSGAKTDNAQARFDNGVLEITLPGAARSVQPQRRRIEIQGAGPSRIGGQTRENAATGQASGQPEERRESAGSTPSTENITPAPDEQPRATG